MTNVNTTPIITLDNLPSVDLSSFSASTLASSSLIVNLSISVWTARKLDKRVSEEVDQAKSTKTRAGNYHKNLLPESKLASIKKIDNACRAWFYDSTQPWGDNGDRLLPVASLLDFKSRLTDYENQFGTAVNEFLNDYDVSVAAAAFQLGDLFNRNDYPTRDRAASKFGFRYTISPLPQSGDFRVDVANDGLRELQSAYDGAIRARVAEAMQDAWERLYTTLTQMSDRLADTTNEDGETKRKIFRDSLIDNAVEVCDLLKAFNITGDTRMDEMRRQLAESLQHLDPQSLRESDDLRRSTKAKVDSLLDKFSSF